jgi:hypothetical protein
MGNLRQTARSAKDAGAAEVVHNSDNLAAQVVAAHAGANKHAQTMSRLTLGGIVVTASLSLISVVMSWYNIHSPTKQAPAAAVYQQHMEILSKSQISATNQQATAVDRLSDTLIDTQKKAAVAERRAVAAAIATNPTKPESP